MTCPSGDYWWVITITSSKHTAITGYFQYRMQPFNRLGPVTTRGKSPWQFIYLFFFLNQIRAWLRKTQMQHWVNRMTGQRSSPFLGQAFSPNPAQWPRVARSGLANPSTTDTKPRLGVCLLALKLHFQLRFSQTTCWNVYYPTVQSQTARFRHKQAPCGSKHVNFSRPARYSYCTASMCPG